MKESSYGLSDNVENLTEEVIENKPINIRVAKNLLKKNIFVKSI